MVTIRLAETPTEKAKFARAALDHVLYVPGWGMYPTLCEIIEDPYCNADITLAVDTEPVGVAVRFLQDFYIGWTMDANSVIVFVTPDFRRLGIGKGLIHAFNTPIEHLISYSGEHGSIAFWRSLGTRDIDFPENPRW
jgi:GNAT superfamily N-acetyltransferase